jgi:general secretion pathway protein D
MMTVKNKNGFGAKLVSVALISALINAPVHGWVSHRPASVDSMTSVGGDADLLFNQARGSLKDAGALAQKAPTEQLFREAEAVDPMAVPLGKPDMPATDDSVTKPVSQAQPPAPASAPQEVPGPKPILPAAVDVPLQAPPPAASIGPEPALPSPVPPPPPAPDALQKTTPPTGPAQSVAPVGSPVKTPPAAIKPNQPPVPTAPSAPGKNMPPPRSPRGGSSASPPPPARGGARQFPQEDIYKVVPQTCKRATDKFIWNFQEDSLSKVLAQTADMRCITIVINDPKAIENTPITIIGKTLLNTDEAWDITLGALAGRGFSLIQQGKNWNLIKRSDSKQFASPFYSKGLQAANNEGIGTLFYKAVHTSPDALKNVSKLLISQNGIAEPVADKFLLVIDTNSNIKRLGHIFDQIDVVDAINKVYVVGPLVYADVKTVEKQLKELYDISANRPRPPMMRRPAVSGDSKIPLDIDKIIADDRTNSLILVADAEAKKEVDSIIKLLDVEAAAGIGKGKIHVRKMRFGGDAKKIAETLNNVVKQGGTRSRFGRPRGDEKSSGIFEGDVQVSAHEDINAVVTVASAADYQALLSTIDQLDIQKPQVYVEAVIMDLQVNGDTDVGINLFSGLAGNTLGMGDGLGMVANPGGVKMAEGIKTTLTATGGAGLDVKGLGNNSVGAIAVLSNFLNGGVAGIVGPSVPGTSIPSFGAVLQALSKSSQVEILSTPTLLTSDNVEGTMSVGEKIPVLKSQTGAANPAGGLGFPTQHISYEDVKLTFKITPNVGDDDHIRLKVVQEVNDQGKGQLINGNTQFNITTKSTDTTVVAKSGQTIVLGGLISEKSTKTDNKVPFLGDIPILGWLFKNRNTNNAKRSLVVVLTAHVIRTPEDFKQIVDRKMAEREEFGRLYFGGKITNYDPYVKYERKTGPLSSLMKSMDEEMKLPENGGGPSEGGKTVIKPNAESTVPALPEESLMDPMENIDNNNSNILENDMSQFHLEDFGEGFQPIQVEENKSGSIEEQTEEEIKPGKTLGVTVPAAG